jgi:hypothetical protein
LDKIVQPCGHDVFCFPCVQGLLECPICSGEVTGWGRIKKQSKPNPFQPSTSAGQNTKVAFPVVTNTIVGEDSNCERDMDLTQDQPMDNAEDLYYSGSDSDEGTRTWCADYEFSQGGARSGQDAIDSFDDAKREEDCTPVLANPLSDNRIGKRFAAVSELLVSGETDVQESIEAQVAQKRARSEKAPPHVQKFKKSVEKAVVDILGPLPNAPSVEKARDNHKDKFGVPAKRGVGRPCGKSKLVVASPLVSSVSTRAASVPANKRATSRRRGSEDGVPIKFRGLT